MDSMDDMGVRNDGSWFRASEAMAEGLARLDTVQRDVRAERYSVGNAFASFAFNAETYAEQMTRLRELRDKLRDDGLSRAAWRIDEIRQRRKIGAFASLYGAGPRTLSSLLAAQYTTEATWQGPPRPAADDERALAAAKRVEEYIRAWNDSRLRALLRGEMYSTPVTFHGDDTDVTI